MLKRAVLVLAACALAIGGPALADAAPKHHKVSRHFTAVERITGISPEGRPPASGKQLSAGVFDGKVAGQTVHGAVRGTTQNKFPSVSATGTVFGPTGSANYRLHGTATLNSDGSVTITGSGRYTGGAGAFRGASGKFTFTGTLPLKSQVVTFNVKGNISY